jgi:hypothetical protein
MITLSYMQRNEELREKLLNGELKPSEFITMDWRQLSTAEQKEKDSKTQVELYTKKHVQ